MAEFGNLWARRSGSSDEVCAVRKGGMGMGVRMGRTRLWLRGPDAADGLDTIAANLDKINPHLSLAGIDLTNSRHPLCKGQKIVFEVSIALFLKEARGAP